MLEGGRKYSKKWADKRINNWKGCCKNWQEHSYISDNAREDITKKLVWTTLQIGLDSKMEMDRKNVQILFRNYCIIRLILHMHSLLTHTKKFRPPKDVIRAIF